MKGLCRLVWLFVLASMAGFLLESGESLLRLGYVENRQGLLYGPFTPVYGAGAVCLALTWPWVRGKSPAVQFALAVLLGSGVEFVWSILQERLFGVVFWDYHHFRFHLDGRVNLLFSLFWGLLGLAFWRWFYPKFLRCWSRPRFGSGLAALALALLLTGDGLWSSAVFVRQAQRQRGVPALSALTVYLDDRWPDAALAARFPAMRLR